MKKIISIFVITLLFGMGGWSVSPAFAMGSKPPEENPQMQKKAAIPEQSAKEFEDQKLNADKARALVIAKVNGDNITMYDLVRMMNRIAPKYVKPNEPIAAELTDKIKKEALDSLIFQELAAQEAVKQEIKIDPQRVEQVISRVKDGLGSDEAYQQYLDKFGFTEETFKQQIERGHRIETITKREIYGKVQVDPKKIEAEYEKLKKAGKLHMAEKYIVKDVLLMQADDEELLKKRANHLLEEIKKLDYDFGKLVLDGTFITRRIQVDKNRNPAVYKAMAKLEVGETSGIIKDKDSYHIIKVLQKDKARNQNLEEARGFIENSLRVPAQDERKAEWEIELKKNAQIEILLDEVEKQLKELADNQKKTEEHS